MFLLCSQGGEPLLWDNLCAASSCDFTHPLPPAPHPPFASGAKASCLPEEKQKTPGTGVADVIFFVCGVSFSFCKINVTKVLEEPENNRSGSRLHQCWFSSLASHADLMLLFLLGPFSPPPHPPPPTPRIGCHTFDLCGFLYCTGPQSGKFGAGSEVLLLELSEHVESNLSETRHCSCKRQ